MRPTLFPCLLVLWILAILPLRVPAAIMPRIAEIRVEGVSVTDPEVVLAQLPFRVGDCWREELAGFAIARLLLPGIYREAPEPPSISVEPDDRGGVIVIVRVSEYARWWQGPLQTGATAALGIVSDQAHHTVYNLTDGGLSMYAWGAWDTDAAGAELDMFQPVTTGTGGLVDAALWSTRRDYEIALIPYGTRNYRQRSRGAQIEYATLRSPRLSLTVNLGYEEDTFEQTDGYGDLLLPTQSYAVLGASLRTPALLRDGLALSMDGRWHAALDGDVPSFLALEGRAEWRAYHGPWGLYLRAAGGVMPHDAPFNRFFSLGGFDHPFLRGSAYDYAGNTYLAGTAELRCRLTPALEVFAFTDYGATWLDGARASGGDLLSTLGGGITYQRGTNLPITLTLGYQPAEDAYAADVRLGYRF